MNKKFLFVFIPVLVLILLAGIFFFLQMSRHSVDYLVRSLDKIGAPSGFVVNHARDEIRSGGFDQPYVRRTYNGSSTLDTVRSEMLGRLRSAGLANARWQTESGAQAAGIVATCKGMAIFVRVYQAGDDPIDIEIHDTSDTSAPDCPVF